MISTSTRLSYANGYLDLGMIDDAAVELNAIPEKDRLREDVLLMRSRFYLEAKNWEDMAAVSEQLVEQCPDTPDAWVNWAYALREMKRTEEARQVALKGLELHRGEATLWYNLACYCSLLGEQRQAKDFLDMAKELEERFEEEAEKDPDLENLREWLRDK